MARQSWIDENTNEPLIDDYAKNLDSFLETFADGIVNEEELQAQETRLIDLMKEIEPKLDDELHAKITRLLCELSAYDIMQYTYEIQEAKTQSRILGLVL